MIPPGLWPSGKALVQNEQNPRFNLQHRKKSFPHSPWHVVTAVCGVCARGGPKTMSGTLLCHSLSYYPETGFLSRARLVTSTPQQYSCLCPTRHWGYKYVRTAMPSSLQWCWNHTQVLILAHQVFLPTEPSLHPLKHLKTHGTGL